MTDERAELEKVLQKMAERCRDVPGLTRVGRFDPRKRLKKIEEHLQLREYEAAIALVEELRQEQIPLPYKIKELVEKGMQLFDEGRAELAKSAIGWIKSKGRRRQKREFFDCMESCIVDFLHLKAEILLADLEISDDPADRLCEAGDVYLQFLDCQREELEKIEADFLVARHDAVVDAMLQIVKKNKNKKLALTDYESEEDWLMLKPEFKASGITLAMEREMIEKARETLLAHGVQLEIKMLNTSAYLRWLAANHLKNTAANRARFIVTPESNALAGGAS